MITIVDADPRWPSDFQQVASRIRDALEPDTPRIDHIGSTSVPGLPSKDVIDVQVTVEDVATLERVADALATHGWRRPAGSWSDHPVRGFPVDVSNWQKVFLNEPPGSRRTHVHVRIDGRPNARYALLFRDFLRAHADEAAAYGELKLRLADLVPDADTYADAKDPVCDLIYFAAERWASVVGWTP